jgi:heat shock protein HslJ
VNDLVGKTWFLQTITKGRAAPQPILQGSQITIFFDPNGAFSGNAGCNSYAGTWTSSDDGTSMSLTLGQVSNMICDDPPGVMEQEQDYLTSLPLVTSFAIGDDGSLSLYTSDQQIYQYTVTP